MKKIMNSISEKFNVLIKNKKKYKFVAYISQDESSKDVVVDAFEIEDYSEKLAYKEALRLMGLKYDKMGFYIRTIK